jgi:hypothetical protein
MTKDEIMLELENLGNEQIDKKAVRGLIARVEKEIKDAPNRVRYTMNGFIIAAGGFVPGLTDRALEAGSNIGKVEVDMGGTACEVPLASEYIEKIVTRGTIGKKKKAARC